MKGFADKELITYLTLSFIYTHFNTVKEKGFWKTLWKKVKLLKGAISPFSTMCSMKYVF